MNRLNTTPRISRALTIAIGAASLLGALAAQAGEGTRALHQTFPAGEEIRLAKQVIETFAAPLNLADYKDEYREGLQKIIDAKVAGEEIVTPEAEAPPKVVNLMEALKKSLDAVSTTKKKPAKAEAKTPAAAQKRKRA
jgi:non-homologous end joining protein Ku